MQTEQERNITLTALDPKNWVGAHADYLFRYAILRVRDEDSAKDLVQDTFLAWLKGHGWVSGKE